MKDKFTRGALVEIDGPDCLGCEVFLNGKLVASTDGSAAEIECIMLLLNNNPEARELTMHTVGQLDFETCQQVALNIQLRAQGVQI